MGFRLKIGVLVLAILGTVLATACTPIPQLTPDVIGLGDLPTPPSDLGASPFPPSTKLPHLQAGKFDPATPGPEYTIGPLDQLVVTIWGRKDLGSQVPVGLNGELRASVVREDGTLLLPFLEPFSVKGKTVRTVRSEIETRYASLFEKPQVDVKLLDCASRAVQVTGEVAKPGKYYLCNERLTVGEVLASAGSVTAATDLARGVLTREGVAYRIDYSPETIGAYAGVLLQDGDAIYFPRSDDRVVHVLGEVIRQGTFSIARHGMTLAEALGRAFGPDNYTYDVGGIYLIRNKKPSGVVVYKLKMAEVLQGPEVPLTDGDRVFVATSGLTRWDRFWRKVLPFGTTFFTSSYSISTP
jgi:protein involved in polysaccharide export with SLBB domain